MYTQEQVKNQNGNKQPIQLKPTAVPTLLPDPLQAQQAAPVTPASILHMQQTVGNASVQRALSRQRRNGGTAVSPHHPITLQRACQCKGACGCHQQEEMLQRTPANIQRDFAVAPVNDAPGGERLNDEEIQSAIEYDRMRFFDVAELQLMRDVLGLAEEPAVIDRDFVLAAASYQHQFGETADGKIGRDSSLALSRELHAESLNRPGIEMGIRGRAKQTAANVDSGGRSDIFDAELDHANARLTLKMRVQFNFVAGNGGAWPDAATQDAWRDQYIRRVQNRWSYKLLMKRRGTSREYLTNYATRVIVTASAASPHYTANVSYATADDGSSVSAGSNSATLDSMDTDVRHRVRHGRDYYQRGAEHEFGHMMGLDHIACAANSDACYGGADQAVRRNIMGSGSAVTTDNAQPFTEAMKIISGQDWDAAPFRTLT